MKNSKQSIGSILVVLAALSAFVWVAWAQDQGVSRGRCGVGAVNAATGACPTTGACPIKAQSLSGVAVYLDSPAMLLARAEVLALTAEQEDTIKAIQASARAKALSTLTDAQKAILGAIPAEPVVLGTAMAKACGEGCTRPCWTKLKAGSEKQTRCPMMDSSTVKALFLLHQGRKANFHCPGLTGVCTRNSEKHRFESSQFNI